ncbi:MAG TPA: tripartite tricarboxylate transporter substrate binding protein [Burkholderiaceae bacterium]|nr:tripartite tricarboxylate transporter substrate binding protein [Burkholderiaceae bacterium]
MTNDLRRTIASMAALTSLGVTALLAPAAPADAQSWPERPVRIVSVSGAGSGVDDYSRQLATYLSAKLGQSFVIENRPGANTIIAAEHVAKATPDGYTMLYGVSSTMSANPVLFKSLPYSPERDFVPVARLSAVPNVLVVPANSPHRTLADLMTAARAQPGKMTVGSATSGYKLFIAAIHEAQKVTAVDVPYKSSAALMQDLIGGQMDYSVLEVSAVAPMVQAGRIRALAVVAPVRVQALPDVPTLAEAGVRGVSLMSWTALFAPAGTPAAIVEKLSRAALEFVDSPQARAHYAQRGTLAYGGTGAELAKSMVDDREQWKRLADLAGMQPQ